MKTLIVWAIMTICLFGQYNPDNRVVTISKYEFKENPDGNTQDWFEKAEEYYLKALKIDPDHIGALEYLGELFFETGRVDKAEDLLERLKSVAGENSEEYLELYEIINS